MFSVYLTLLSLIEKGKGVDDPTFNATLNLLSHDHHQIKLMLQDKFPASCLEAKNVDLKIES